MNSDLDRSLPTLFGELVYGVPGEAFVLNPGDQGLLGSLDRLSALDASASHDGGGTIAAHVEHLAFGLSLMNRWAAGERNPFAGADWSAAWRRGEVSDDEWSDLRGRLRNEIERWHGALAGRRDARGVELDTVIGTIVHLAYHFGAIRQIHSATRGPRATAP